MTDPSGVTFCPRCQSAVMPGKACSSILCREHTRARLQDKVPQPRDLETLATAPKETVAVPGGPLVDRTRFADQLPPIWQDAPPPNPDIPRIPWAIRSLRDIQPDEELDIHQQPCLSFRGECFRVARGSLGFEMTYPIAGNIVCEVGMIHWIQCTLYDQWKRYDLPLITPANEISFRVRNRMPMALPFCAMFFGTVEPY